MKKENKTILSLMELQSQRSSIIKMMNATRSQIISYITRVVGYNSFQDEKERTKKWALGEQIFKSITKNQPSIKGYEEETSVVKDMAEASQTSLVHFEIIRIGTEKQMKALAQQLSVYDWWVLERGRGTLGLAIIIGEAGDLRNYGNPAKLWKRFGLAVMEGVRQGGLPKNSPAEQWIEHGYNPRRRSVIWTIGDSLLKTNGKEGRYKQAYDKRKKYEMTKLKQKWIKDGKDKKKFKPGHAHNRAKRYMEKKLLCDLWNECNLN